MKRFELQAEQPEERHSDPGAGVENVSLDDVRDETPDEFEEAYGVKLEQAIDLNTWSTGEDLSKLYAELEEQVHHAVEEEKSRRQYIRNTLFPKIAAGRYSVPTSGLHCFDVPMLERAHRGLLFNGSVEACDGTSVVHDTLPVTITQIGVYLVSYNGEQGSYVQRLYRKDFQSRSADPEKEVLELLERRQKRGAQGQEDAYDEMSQLARRGLMAYAERALLLEKSQASWRLGHGNPTPYELMTGHWAHHPHMVDAALGLMSKLVLDHERFVFVPSAPRQRAMLTLGYALKPLEYLILRSLKVDLLRRVESGGYRGENRTKVEEFAREVGDQVVVGLYRVSETSPPYMFYAHRDHAQTAALIAMGDSALQMHRGFPMLIDLADRMCRTTFGADDFVTTVQQAYSHAGQPYQYLGERETRR